MAHVLVLCQRKTGPDVKYTVDPIMELIVELVGPTKNITFMSDKGHLDGEVDIDEFLSMSNSFTKKFIVEKDKHYDLVLLNTCPFQLVDYKIIYLILKNTGLLALTAFNKDSNHDDKIPKILKLLTRVEPFYRYFGATGRPNIFRKNIQSAGSYSHRSLSDLRTLCNSRGMSCYTKDKTRFLTRKEILNMLNN